VELVLLSVELHTRPYPAVHLSLVCSIFLPLVRQQTGTQRDQPVLDLLYVARKDMMDYHAMTADPYRYYHIPQYAQQVHPTVPYPQFRSFAVPHRPAELGFADLHRSHQHPPRFTQPPFYTYTHVPPPQQQTMAFMQSGEDLAEFQRLSNNYEPEATVRNTVNT